MSGRDGLSFAYLLDGKGGGRPLGWDEIHRWKPEDGLLWVHLERDKPGSQKWLRGLPGMSKLTCQALLAEETRPRSAVTVDGVLAILRGVNLHPGSDPDDMVSIRTLVANERIITLSKREVIAIRHIRETVEASGGPCSSAEFLAQLCVRLIDRMGPVLEELNDEVDAMEEQILEAASHELRYRLSNLRRTTINLRRYLAPQREVMAHLQAEPVAWIDEIHRAQLREAADTLMRYVEDLDSARERAAVTHEELVGRISDQMSKTMYVLSLIAGIFLPLGLLTGLLGINVGGIPGTESKHAFLIVCGLLITIAVVQAWVFRKMKWF
ncbi:zinc transporter ZntB [Candidatus Sumerlaeota bacterium]